MSGRFFGKIESYILKNCSGSSFLIAEARRNEYFSFSSTFSASLSILSWSHFGYSVAKKKPRESRECFVRAKFKIDLNRVMIESYCKINVYTRSDLLMSLVNNALNIKYLLCNRFSCADVWVGVGGDDSYDTPNSQKMSCI